MNKLEYVAGEPEVPKTLEECFEKLKVLCSDDLEQFRKTKEKDLIHFHFTLGMWLRNNWKLWGGVLLEQHPLKKYFLDLGLFHPDDMSHVIIVSFWRHLNNKPLEMKAQARHFIDYWLKEKAEEHENDKICVKQNGRLNLRREVLKVEVNDERETNEER
jgi:hypothetical protein